MSGFLAGVSQLLGYLVVGGSFVVKLPQLRKILSQQSVAGIALPTVAMEQYACLASLAYAVQISNSPFSTYGESLFMFLQNLGIIATFTAYSHHVTERKSAQALLSILIFLLATLYFGILPAPVVVLAQQLQTPVVALTRIPQVYANYRDGNTGVLSFVTTVMQWGGSAARCMTTAVLVKDPLVLLPFALNFFFHSVVMLQFYAYWNVKPKPHAHHRSHTD